MEAATATIPSWLELARDPAFLGGELETGPAPDKHFPEGQFKSRGRIKSIKVDGDEVTVELEWVACRRHDKDDWVWAPTLSKTHTFSSSWREHAPPVVGEDGCLSFDVWPNGHQRHFRLRPETAGNLDPARIMTEYHIAVQVNHSLHPPAPFGDLEHVGMSWESSPRLGDADTRGHTVVFVVHAFSLKGAKSWCRGECARWNLPIIGMRETHLRPGY